MNLLNLLLSVIKKIGILIYLLRPIPFGLGYNQYKIYLIKKKIRKKPINIKKYIDERIIEIPWIIKNLGKYKSKNILDAGCTLNFDYLINRILKNNNNILFTNIFQEKYKFYSKSVKYITGDVSNLPLKNNHFDAVTCLSVLEHVGFNNNMYDYKKKNKSSINFRTNKNLFKKAIKEFNRVLKPNKWLYLSFPFGKKMIFDNFQQFDMYDLKKMIKVFSPKKFILNFYMFEDMKWKKVFYENCRNCEPIYKDNTGISSKSIVLLKMKK